MSEKQRIFLKFLRMEAFGAFINRTVGPFAPGMNVVFGKNEAGKSSLAAFIDGVLFGWREARSRTNTYKPDNAERMGSLYFAETAPVSAAAAGVTEATASATNPTTEERDQAGNFPMLAGDGAEPPAPLYQVSRARNAEGLQGAYDPTDDIDAETYRTVFSLTSEKLLSLKNTSDITAKLLTAGSGTETSPAFTLTEVQRRLAALTSTAAANTHSLTNLAQRRQEVQQQLAEAASTSERYRTQSRELTSLEADQRVMSERLSGINRSIDNLSTCIGATERIDGEFATLDAEAERLMRDEADTRAKQTAAERGIGAKLAALTSSEERAMRERIQRLSTRREHHIHSLNNARENMRASKAIYNVLVEEKDSDTGTREQKRTRTAQILLAVVVPIVLLLCGVLLFVLGQRAPSLSMTVLGAGLIASALIITSASLVLLIRPRSMRGDKEDQLENSRWVMLQDEKKYESCDEELAEFDRHIAATLAEMGLADAGGSLGNALGLLDEAREVRSEIGLLEQKRQSVEMRLDEVGARRDELAAQRAQLYARANVDVDATLAQLEAELDSRMLQRDGLLETLEHMSARHGELKQILTAARDDSAFNGLKIQYQEILAAIEDSTEEYMKLLLAERLLQKTIDAWEAITQPEVYRLAGRLLALMTDGVWRAVQLGSDGELFVSDGALTTRSVSLLSLGTCQQLYLALRIALLMTADNVGRAMPVVADDILVNFDADRRVGAARALLELSRVRQVILLTCHREVVDALQKAAADVRAPIEVLTL